MTDDTIGSLRSRYALLGQAICAALNEHLYTKKVVSKPLVPDFEQADFSLERDAFSGEYSLQATWRNDKGQKTGTVIIHNEKQFHAEYDVIRPMPGRRDLFIEAVTAWGGHDGIKSELRLLPVLN